MANLRRNVLIFHSGALGDFVVTWPLALAAGRVLAQGRIFYVTASQKGALAERVLRLDSADIEAGWHPLFIEGATAKLSERSMKLLDGAQLIFTFLAEPGDVWTRNVQTLAPEAKIVHLKTKPADGANVHVTEFLRDQLTESFPPLAGAMESMLRSIRERGVNGIRENRDGPVVIHPGAGAGKKCWPAERFVELAEKFKASGKSVRFVVGEVELETWPADQLARLKGIVGELSQPKTYIELFDLVQTASTFIGNDTGPTHLAAITGVNVVALFGTDPTRWSPIGPRVNVIRAKGDAIESISVDEVLAVF